MWGRGIQGNAKGKGKGGRENPSSNVRVEKKGGGVEGCGRHRQAGMHEGNPQVCGMCVCKVVGWCEEAGRQQAGGQGNVQRGVKREGRTYGQNGSKIPIKSQEKGGGKGRWGGVEN